MKKLLCWIRGIHSLWSAGGQGWCEFCELMQRWDLLIPMKHSLVQHIFYRTEGKIFSLHSHSPTPSASNFSLRALWVMFPPFMPKPPHSLGHSFGIFSTTHSIKKWSAMKTLPVHHKWGEDLSQKWDIRCNTPESSLLLAGEVMLRAWWLQADGRSGLGVLAVKTCFQSRADCPPSKSQSLPFGEPWTATGLAESLWRCSREA